MTFFVIIGFHLSLNSGFYSFVNNSSTTKINPNGLAHKSYDMAINNTFIVSAPTKEKKNSNEKRQVAIVVSCLIVVGGSLALILLLCIRRRKRLQQGKLIYVPALY